jgi:hypothetical protein
MLPLHLQSACSPKVGQPSHSDQFGKGFLRIHISTKVAMRALKGEIKRFQRENGLKSEGEALEAIILALPSSYSEGRALWRVKRRIRYLLKELTLGTPITERHRAILEELAAAKRGGSGNEVASNENPAEEDPGGEILQGEGRDQMVQAFERGERSEGGDEVETLRSSEGGMCEMSSEGAAGGVEAGE